MQRPIRYIGFSARLLGDEWPDKLSPVQFRSDHVDLFPAMQYRGAIRAINFEVQGPIIALSAGDVESASEVSSPAISGAIALTAEDVEASTEVSSPSLGDNALDAADIESA